MIKTILMIASCWWYAVDADGVVIGGKVAPRPQLSEFPGAVHIIKGPAPARLKKTLGPLDDRDTRTLRWKYSGGKFQKRSDNVISTAKNKVTRKRNLKLFLNARRAWKEGLDARSADPNSVTLEDIDALRSEVDRLKGLMR